MMRLVKQIRGTVIKAAYQPFRMGFLGPCGNAIQLLREFGT